MRQGRWSQRADDLADELRVSIQDGYKNGTDVEREFFSEELSAMEDLEDRDARVIALHTGLRRGTRCNGRAGRRQGGSLNRCSHRFA